MYYGVREVAQRWQVSECTIRRWLAQGIPGSLQPFNHSRVGRAVRWSESQLEELEAGMRRAGVGPAPRPRRRRSRVS